MRTTRRSPPASLIVSVTGAAAIAASQPSVVERRRGSRATSSGVDERARGVVDEHDVGVAGRGAARRATDCERCAPPTHADRARRAPSTPGRQRDDDALDRRHGAQGVEAPLEHRTAAHHDERLGPVGPKALATAGGHERARPPLSSSAASGRCGARLGGLRQQVVEVLPRRPSSSISSAYISSEARIFLARVNICFSPVDRPFWCSRMARLRTTSASS